MGEWENKRINILIDELCTEVDYWKSRCLVVEAELKRLKEKRHKEVIKSIKHNEAMMSNFLKLALTSNKKQMQKAFGQE